MSAPTPILDGLRQILLQAVTGCSQLVDLAREERRALKTRDLRALVEITRNKEDLLVAIATCDRERNRLVTTLREAVAIVEPVSFATLQEYDNDASGLRELNEKLTELGRQLKVIHEENNIILNAELARVDATISYLSSLLVPQEATYSADEAKNTPLTTTGAVLNWQA